MIYTIGHSTRTTQDFIEILKLYKIEMVIDIRTIPRSGTNPQFNEETLSKSLKKQGISYCHLKELGGFRKPSPHSINKAWKSPAFRGYADYMQTDEFKNGLELLINIAKENQVVIMCAEAVPWRCHRSLVADALSAHKITVEDIFSLHEVRPHKLTAFAQVDGYTITYPKI